MDQPVSDHELPQTWSERQHAGMRHRINAVGVPGSVPLGYRIENNHMGAGSHIVTEAPAAYFIDRAFRLMDTKEYPLRTLLTKLNATGFVSKNGNPLSVASFWYILTNPFYCGLIRAEGEWIKGRHQPIVGRSRFERVQQKLQGRQRSRRRLQKEILPD